MSESRKRRGLAGVASVRRRKRANDDIRTVSVMRVLTATTEPGKNATPWAVWRSPNFQDFSNKQKMIIMDLRMPVLKYICAWYVLTVNVVIGEVYDRRRTACISGKLLRKYTAEPKRPPRQPIVSIIKIEMGILVHLGFPGCRFEYPGVP